MTTRILINNLTNQIDILGEQVQSIIDTQGDFANPYSRTIELIPDEGEPTGIKFNDDTIQLTAFTGNDASNITNITSTGTTIDITGDGHSRNIEVSNYANLLNNLTSTGNTITITGSGHELNIEAVGAGGGVVDSIVANQKAPSTTPFLIVDSINPAIPKIDINVPLPTVSGMSLNANTNGTLFWEERLQSITANQQDGQVYTYLTLNKADAENNLIDLNVGLPTAGTQKVLSSTTNGLLSWVENGAGGGGNFSTPSDVNLDMAQHNIVDVKKVLNTTDDMIIQFPNTKSISINQPVGELDGVYPELYMDNIFCVMGYNVVDTQLNPPLSQNYLKYEPDGTLTLNNGTEKLICKDISLVNNGKIIFGDNTEQTTAYTGQGGWVGTATSDLDMDSYGIKFDTSIEEQRYPYMNLDIQTLSSSDESITITPTGHSRDIQVANYANLLNNLTSTGNTITITGSGHELNIEAVGGGEGIVEEVLVRTQSGANTSFLTVNNTNPAMPVLDLNVVLPSISGMSLNATTDGLLFWEERLQSITANQQDGQVYTYLTLNKSDPENNLIDLNVNMPTGTDTKFLTSTTNGLLSFQPAIQTLTSSSNTITITQNSGSSNNINLGLSSLWYPDATSSLQMNDFPIESCGAIGSIILDDIVPSTSPWIQNTNPTTGLSNLNGTNFDVFPSSTVPIQHLIIDELVGSSVSGGYMRVNYYVPSGGGDEQPFIWTVPAGTIYTVAQAIYIPLQVQGTDISAYNFFINSKAYITSSPNFWGVDYLTITGVQFVTIGIAPFYYVALSTDYNNTGQSVQDVSISSYFKIESPVYDIPDGTVISSNGVIQRNEFNIPYFTAVFNQTIGLTDYTNNTVDDKIVFQYHFDIDVDIQHLVIGENDITLYPRISILKESIKIEASETSNLVLSADIMETQEILATDIEADNIQVNNSIEVSNELIFGDGSIQTKATTYTTNIYMGDPNFPENYPPDGYLFGVVIQNGTLQNQIRANNDWDYYGRLFWLSNSNNPNSISQYYDKGFDWVRVNFTVSYKVQNFVYNEDEARVVEFSIADFGQFDTPNNLFYPLAFLSPNGFYPTTFIKNSNLPTQKTNIVCQWVLPTNPSSSFYTANNYNVHNLIIIGRCLTTSTFEAENAVEITYCFVDITPINAVWGDLPYVP